MPSLPHRSLYADDPLMQPLITDFVARLSQQVTQIRQALAANDPEPLRRIAHQLKGSGKSFGFEPITTHAATILEKLHANLPLQSATPDTTALLTYIEQIENYKPQ